MLLDTTTKSEISAVVKSIEINYITKTYNNYFNFNTFSPKPVCCSEFFSLIRRVLSIFVSLNI